MSAAVLSSNQPKKYYLPEVVLLLIVGTLLVAGIVLSYTDKQWFEDVYTREDGFVENFTVLPLTVAFFVAAAYIVKLGRYRSWMFIICMVFAALFSLFVGGEEISWGQRIFHVQSSEFFKEHNAQGETNLHNMVVEGEKVNKIVFTWFLSLAIAVYLLLIPYLYKKKAGLAHFIDRAGIPIPRRLHIIAALVLFVGIGIIPSPKGSELLEAGITSIFLLILLYPQNLHVFRKTALNQ